MASPADPVRQQVDATLHRFVDVVTTWPCGLLRATRRTIAESISLARTMFNHTVGGLLGGEVDAGVPRLETVGAGAASTFGAAGDSVPRAAAGDRAGAAHLAIPGYEDLAASHIVARLDRLSPSELIEIRTFEVANRGRRTVVGKIDQLLARP